jgi:hypothetical protein
MEANVQADRRRDRRRASAFVESASAALKQSQRLVLAGDVTGAARAALLAERHAQLAERLINLKAALRRIAEAHQTAQRSLEAQVTAQEAALKAREQKLYIAELELAQQRQSHTLDPEADRWKERLAHMPGATET